jgi:hypothetical protein
LSGGVFADLGVAGEEEGSPSFLKKEAKNVCFSAAF